MTFATLRVTIAHTPQCHAWQQQLHPSIGHNHYEHKHEPEPQSPALQAEDDLGRLGEEHGIEHDKHNLDEDNSQCNRYAQEFKDVAEVLGSAKTSFESLRDIQDDSIHTWTSPGWFHVGKFQVPGSGSAVPKMVPQLSHALLRRNWHTISNCFQFFLCPSKTWKHQKHWEEQLLYLFNF